MVLEFLKQRLSCFSAYHPTKRMTYEDGLMLIALLKAYEKTQNTTFWNGLFEYLDAHIAEDGTITNYQKEEYNIDNILAGSVLFRVYEITKNPKFKKAIESLASQLKTHPRTESGSFWHKNRYPYQIWLDGLYMGQVFYLQYALFTKQYSILKDIQHQFQNVNQYLYHSKSNLFRHAYDETKTMQWADQTTGQSPHVWSRSVGWYAMALVDLFELVPSEEQELCNLLSTTLNTLMVGLLPYQDTPSHMWYQLVEYPHVEENYLETSGSAMIAYAMIKGSRLGMLDSSFKESGVEVLSGIDKTYLRQDDQGSYHLGGICQVAGLDNERRDGSIAYYLSEKIVSNEIKGVAPYLFAKLELYQSSK